MKVLLNYAVVSMYAEMLLNMLQFNTLRSREWRCQR
jgi:hypothetical protein